MRRLVLPVIGVALSLAVALWWAQHPDKTPEATRLDVAAALGGPAEPGHARATAARAFRFPADHGPHPEYRNEWWYFTGNLSATDGRRYGYQFTLFRIALSPAASGRESRWATRQVYMAHFALTDAAGGRFYAYERFARGALELAGARAEPFAVWIEDWTVQADGQRPQRWRLRVADGDVALDLVLEPAKPVVLQGEAGLSRKSAEPGNASYYYSIPRLVTDGALRIGAATVAVHGQSWFDREWSTSALGSDQAGWDWFALHLDDDTELMVYRLRRRDGSVDPFSAGLLVDARGRGTRLGAGGVDIEVLDHWRSPRGGDYPARWRLTLPAAQLTLDIAPVLADQELALAVRYWEGAVDVRGTRAGREVRGAGYVELTGYAGTLGDRPARR